MAVSEAEIKATVQALIPELREPRIGVSEDISLGIQAALEWHARFRPRVALAVITGDGSGEYPLPDDVLRVRFVEAPYGRVPPSTLPTAAWEVALRTGGWRLLISPDPGLGTEIGVHYLGVWTFSTLPAGDRNKVAYLAAAWLSLRRATIAAASSTPIITADTTNFANQTRQWIQLHDKFIGLYAAATGLSAEEIIRGRPDPACGVGQMPSSILYPRVFWDDRFAFSAGKR